MKKSIARVCFLLLIATVIFTGCEAETTQVISSEIAQKVEGSYFLFKTRKVQEYLNFLEDFDETKYEIVDISTSMTVSGYGSDEFYMVTYKAREFENQ